MKKILIIDDLEENLYMLQSLFTAQDYSVYRASNGREGLELANDYKPDLIISDILMPEMDGFTLCRELKKNTSLRHIPFIFYTATYTDKRDEKLALSLGADRFLIKPLEPERLIAIVDEVMDEHLEHREVTPEKLPGEREYLKVYNQSLIHKLEDKLEELRQSNLALEAEIQNRKKAETVIEQSLTEKEILLKEVYHRTKNNMQVIIALLDLQSRKTSNAETQDILRDMGSRIYSMSLVHDLLYRSKNLSDIRLDIYLTKLAESLISVYETEDVEIELQVDSVKVPISLQFAVPLGLVINEIISNSLKYAFNGKRQGLIAISARNYGQNGIDLEIWDNGQGLDHPDQIREDDTLGLKLIQELIENQLSGDLEMDGGSGLKYTISIPNMTLED